MIEVRPFERLGRFDNDWLAARYHFCFSEYYDPARLGFGPLRVWNDDTIQPRGGFDSHGHRDMEIITYVRRGAISHGDHLGNRSRTGAGDVQVMSAGKGIMHAEFNLEEEPTTLFQIWIEPAERGLAPHWAQRQFPAIGRSGRFTALASGRPGDSDSLRIHQDAALFGAALEKGQSVTHGVARGRRAYLVPATGSIMVNGVAAKARDGIAITDEETLTITAGADAEIVLADLP